MDIFKKLRNQKSDTPTEKVPTKETAPVSRPAMIDVYDNYGRKLQVTREVWRTQMLPDAFKKNWNDPNNLYSITAQTLRDGFIEEALEPARQLVRIDPDHVRAATILGVVLWQLKRHDEAEKVYIEAKNNYPENGLLLCNLAKVYSAQGKTELSRDTLFHSLEVDPNQENGLLWYFTLEKERGGEAAAQEALKRISSFPNSWRADLWIARNALAEKNIELAKQHYKKVFETAKPLPADALMQISGDLGRAGFLDEIITIALPRYEITQHGIAAANNILKAYLDLKQPAEARLLLEKLYAQKRPDWKDTLQFWENEIEKLTIPENPFEKDEKPDVMLLSVEGPIWAREASGFKKYLPEKSAKATTIAFVCGSAEFQQNEGGDIIRSQKASAAGQFTRGLPLFLAEQVHLQTEAKGVCIVPWVKQGAFVLPGKPWMFEQFASIGTGDTDYMALLHVSALSEPWNVQLSLTNCHDRTLVHTWEFSLDLKDCNLTIQLVLDGVFDQLKKTANLVVKKNNLFSQPEQNWLAAYTVALQQALAVLCVTDMSDADSALYSERNIIDALINLSASQPTNIPARLLLMSTMLKECKRRPNIVKEYYQKVENLQKDKPLHGEIGEAVKQACADLAVAIH